MIKFIRFFKTSMSFLGTYVLVFFIASLISPVDSEPFYWKKTIFIGLITSIVYGLFFYSSLAKILAANKKEK